MSLPLNFMRIMCTPHSGPSFHSLENPNEEEEEVDDDDDRT